MTLFRRYPGLGRDAAFYYALANHSLPPCKRTICMLLPPGANGEAPHLGDGLSHADGCHAGRYQTAWTSGPCACSSRPGPISSW